jgi:DNA replication protein DnaC
VVCAFGKAANRSGCTMLCLRTPRLFETLQQCRGDGTHFKALAQLSRLKHLIFDDLLLTPLADWEHKNFLNVIEYRYQIVASQWPIGDDIQYRDPTLAEAISGRL